MKKTYVLDTNVLLNDPNSIYSFGDNDVIVPLVVLEELDRFKNKPDEIGQHARQVCRLLDKVREDGGSLVEGVTMPNGGTLTVVTFTKNILDKLPAELQADKVDNQLIAFMLHLNELNEHSAVQKKIVLVSKDINVRIKCDSLGVACDDYLKMRVASDVGQLYSGVLNVEVGDHVITRFYENGKLDLQLEIELMNHTIQPNQIVILRSSYEGQKLRSAVSRCVVVGSNRTLVKIKEYDKSPVFGMKARNKEQSFALDLLLDPDVKLVTLCGIAGTGKTALAIAAALDQLNGVGSNPRYDKLIVTRPVQPLGKDIGFLPGTLEEKMSPWLAPINDNIDFLVNNVAPKGRKKATDAYGKPESDDGRYFSILKQRGLIEVEAITFIRGRSIPNAFMIVDEAQNISMHELKTIITRVGEGTKIVLTGDIEQIDNTHVDTFTNGLTYAIEKFKEYPIAGHVSLQKGVRSALASLGAEIL
jgi:PhoH-like ATPase